MDAPDPTDARHEHLFGHHDPSRAMVELGRISWGSPQMARCVLCGVALDLVESLCGTPAARRPTWTAR